MAEIDNWIKEQLKKGYSKEQIKEGLRKAGYQQDIIDSVDSFAKKNKQTKQLIISSTVFLVVVIIIWLVIDNYADTNREVSEVQQLNPSFSYDHPITLKEFNNFKDLCVGALDRGITALEGKELLEEQEVKEVFCTLESREDCANCAGKYFRVFRILSIVPEFKAGQYISIAVGLNDLIKKLPDISEDDSFNFCSIAEPPLEDPLSEEMNLEQNLIFPEGEIFCSETFELNIPYIASFTGFVPQVDSFNAEIYLVPQEVIPEILTKKSFPEAKNIVESYTLLWQLEIPIVNVSLPRTEAKNEE